jgi:WD40 repeat protein
MAVFEIPSAASLHCSGDGRVLLVVEGDQQRIHVLHALTLEKQNCYEFEHPIERLAVDRQGRMAVAIVSDEGLAIFDARTGRVSQKLRTPVGPDRFVAISSNAEYVVAGAGASAMLFRVSSLGDGLSLPGLAQWGHAAAAFSPDGRILATFSGREIRLWHVETGQQMLRIVTNGLVMNALFSSNGRALAYWSVLENGESELHLIAPRSAG